MGKVSYSAVVLDEISRTQILEKFPLPDGWKTYAHHMTLCLGELPEDWKSRIGEEVTLQTDKIGRTDLAIALRVSSMKRLIPGTPHITLSIDWDNGGRPKDSNQITAWTLDAVLSLTGTIQEISF